MQIKSINKTAWIQIEKEKNSEDFSVELRDETLFAKTNVYGYLSEGIVDFFAYMKDSWNKTPEPKSWASLEGQFELTFKMDKLGHITLVVSLCPNLFDGWKVTSNIYLEPGQLNAIYDEIFELFINEKSV